MTIRAACAASTERRSVAAIAAGLGIGSSWRSVAADHGPRAATSGSCPIQVLGRTARTVAHAVERWADEDAATAVTDWRLTARTLARTALLTWWSRMRSTSA